MTEVRFGVVAEDATDCAAIRVIVRRVRGTSVGVKPRSGRGCSRLRKKLRPILAEFEKAGCGAVIVLHDLDRNPDNGELNDEAKLRADLESIVDGVSIPKIICIPVEELEAWFWSDQAVLDKVARAQGKAKASHHPDKIKKPKEALIRLSVAENAKPRYSTNDNASLAELLDLEQCSSRCSSFGDLIDFIRSV